MITSTDINEIAAACAKAQAELENVAKDGSNPHFKSRYATLAAVMAEVRPKYAKHGVAIWQAAINGEGSNIGVVTRFAHSSGQWIESTLYVAPAKFDAQGAGSVMSYLRRYSLMAMAGVSADDDDGDAAVARPEQRARSNGHSPPPPPRPTPQAAPIAPPHDPETGEIAPHAIEALNPIDWGGKFIAAIKTAASQAAIDEWCHHNQWTLDDLEKNHPKPWRLVDAALAAQRAKIGPEPEMLSAEEAESVMR